MPSRIHVACTLHFMVLETHGLRPADAGDMGRALGEDGPNMHILACTMLGYCGEDLLQYG